MPDRERNRAELIVVLRCAVHFSEGRWSTTVAHRRWVSEWKWSKWSNQNNAQQCVTVGNANVWCNERMDGWYNLLFSNQFLSQLSGEGWELDKRSEVNHWVNEKIKKWRSEVNGNSVVLKTKKNFKVYNKFFFTYRLCKCLEKVNIYRRKEALVNRFWKCWQRKCAHLDTKVKFNWWKKRYFDSSRQCMTVF